MVILQLQTYIYIYNGSISDAPDVADDKITLQPNHFLSVSADVLSPDCDYDDDVSEFLRAQN
jgi:hypothetical protein